MLCLIKVRADPANGPAWGRQKQVIAPDGSACLLHPALTPPGQGAGLAFRWRRMLETGEVSTVGEIAVREKINKSYVSRVLRRLLPSPGNAIVGLVKRSRNHATNSPCITG